MLADGFWPTERAKHWLQPLLKRSPTGATRLTNVKNPVVAARVVMEQTPHVLMCGREAEQLELQAQREEDLKKEREESHTYDG